MTTIRVLLALLACLTLTVPVSPGGSEFNGSTSVIEIPHHAALTSLEMSLGCWVRYEGFGELNLGRILEKAGDWLLRVESPDRVAFSPTAWTTTDGNWRITTLAVNTWGRVLVTYDAGSPVNAPLMYLNGVSQSVTPAAGPVGTYVPGTGSLFIGNSDAAALRTFDGQLADCLYVNRILTPGEVAQDYAAGPATLRPTGLWMLGEGGAFNRTATSGLHGTGTAISVSTVPGPPRRYAVQGDAP